MGLDAFKEEFDYATGQETESIGKLHRGSLFELKPPMPGVMTREEVEDQIDLGSWRLQLQEYVYTLQVRGISFLYKYRSTGLTL